MLTSYRNDHITQIRQWNRDLSELANGGKKSLAGLNLDQPKIDISLLDYHKRIQKHAKFIYYALKEKIESPMCKCGIPHSVHLQLQMRGTPPTKALSKAGAHISSPNKSLTFNFIFSTEASATERTTIQWKEFQLEHIEERRGVKSIGVKRQPATEIILSSPSSSSSSVASLPERGRPKSRGKADQPKSPLMDKPPLTEFLGASSPTTYVTLKG